jgi:putative sterol carrier protein
LKAPRVALAKFLSDEYFRELQTSLVNDQKWNEDVKGIKTSILLGVTDTGQSYLLSVDNGVTALQKSSPGAQAEFSFDGTYDSWTKIAKGDLDLQTAVLKGELRFKGSITKILAYRSRFMRIAELIKDSKKEY